MATSFMSELRVVLLGNSWSERSSVGNVLLGETVFLEEEPDQCLRVKGQLTDTQSVLIINTPDLLRPGVNLAELVDDCVRLSDPGPHVLLLVLQPEDLSEEQKRRLCRILQLFSDRSFDQSLVLISAPREETSAKNYMNHPALKSLIEKCRYRYLKLKKLPPLRLLTPNVLGQTELGSASSSSECVEHQGEVCVRWVSLVELPASSGKAPQTVMEESFRCVSLCGPEGVHAFILVLPVAPLTDEDKAELENIHNTFSSAVSDFTMILFTVDSDHTNPAVGDFRENRDVQQLSQRCGGRCFILNKNSGSCYKNNTDELSQADKSVKEEKEKRRINKRVRRKHKTLKRSIKKNSQQKRATEQREKRLMRKDEEAEIVQQEWRREREQRESAERKLELCRKQVERDREAWDKEKKELKQRLNQLETCCTKLTSLLVLSVFLSLVYIL